VDDVHVELGGVHAQRFVEFRSRVIVQVHGDVHGQAKESTPQLGFRVVQEFRSRLQDGGEEVTVSVFILAPVFKVLEDRVQLVVRVRLQVSVDRDVSPVANLFGQVRRVHDKLRLEKRVLSVLGQETQIQGQVKVTHRFVQETSVSGFVSGHERKDLRDSRCGFLQASAEFLVQKKAGEFRRARSLEKFDEDSSLFALDVVRGFLELVVADEVLLVEIVSELVQDGEDLRLVEIRVDFRRKELFHFVEIGGVKSRRQQVLVGGFLDAVSHLLDPGLIVDHGSSRARGDRDLSGRRFLGREHFAGNNFALAGERRRRHGQNRRSHFYYTCDV
jgi:hypothetical protein